MNASARSLIRQANYVNGQWAAEGSGQTLPVLHKYAQEALAELPLASAAQMEEAVAAASAFAREMKGWSAGKRSELLYKLRDEVAAHETELVDLIVAEAGKPLGYAQTELKRALSTLDYAAAEALRFGGEVVPMDFGAGEGRTALTKRFPVGPVGCITPFNFPLNLLLHKVAPAFAVGCPVVVKPAVQTPLTALAFAELCERAGYPAGAISVLSAENHVSEMIVADERIKMLSFTGSDKVGWMLKAKAGKKRVALELGGNAAAYVDESADLEFAAKKLAVGCFLYAGQICISTQRVYVHESVYEDFTALLVAESAKLPVGDPAKESTVVGPLIDAKHFARVSEWVGEGLHAGAKLLMGGKAVDEARNLYAPTLLADAPKGAKLVEEEAFGPVAALSSVASFEAGCEAVNDSKYGLQAGVFSDRAAHLKAAHELLEVGGVLFNEAPGFRIDHMPYGGVKDSGLGREGLRYAMQEMTEPRLLVY